MLTSVYSLSSSTFLLPQRRDARANIAPGSRSSRKVAGLTFKSSPGRGRGRQSEGGAGKTVQLELGASRHGFLLGADA